MEDKDMRFLTLYAPLENALEFIENGEIEAAKSLLIRILSRAKTLGQCRAMA